MSELLSGLNDMQIKAVTTTEGAVLVIAGAGSGKTTVITRRIGYILEQGLAKPWQILAITFTNKAAAEMLERVGKLVPECAGDIWVKTFHSTCLRMLRRDIDKIGYSSNFNIYDTTDQKKLVKECIVACGFSEDNYPVKSVMNAISGAKNQGKSAKDFALENENDFRGKNYAKMYEFYEKRLRENNALDFDDLLLKTVELFEKEPDILNYYRNKFKYIMVDEYQDTNHVQYKLVSMLTGSNGNICVVGDDDQSIYKFRGADISNILDFEKQFKDAVNIKLEQNYRSTQNILTAANSVISHNLGRKGKELWTDKGDGEQIVLKSASNQIEEAMYIGGEIEKLIKSGEYSYSDCAILYRTNAQTRSFEENLTCPYRILSGLRFYDRKEIKDILSYIRVIFNPADDVNLARIINTPKRGIGDTTISKISALAQSLGKSMFDILTTPEYLEPLGKARLKLEEFASLILDLKSMVDKVPLPELFDAIYEKTGYMDSLLAEKSIEAQGRIENLEEFKSKGAEYENNVENPTFEGFLDNISLVSDVDNYDEEQNAVVMMTLHSAKGLEFPVVFICGMETGLFPGSMAEMYDEEMEEERRLCYVGITRAKKKLYLTWAKQRMLYGKTESRLISKFVGEIPKELVFKIPEPNAKSFSYGGNFEKATPQPKSFGTKESLSSVLSTYGIGTAGAKVSEANSTPCELKKGDRVSHKKFGLGMVTDVIATSGDTELEILFDKVGTRKLLASFAKLDKI